MTMHVKMCGDRHERATDFDSPGSPIFFLVSEADCAAVAHFRGYGISMLVAVVLWGLKLITSGGHYV